jgi:hypothetical protein
MFAEAKGYEMPDFTASNYPYFLGYALLIWVGVRAIASPYFIWRDETDRVDILEGKLAEPEFIERKWLANYLAERKAKIAEAAARMVTLANDSSLWRLQEPNNEDSGNPYMVAEVEEYTRAQSVLMSGIEELSYLPDIRQLGLDLNNACNRLTDDSANHADPREARSDMYRLRAELIRNLHMR